MGHDPYGSRALGMGPIIDVENFKMCPHDAGCK